MKMESTAVFLGIILCLLFATLTDSSKVTAPEDIEVRATPNVITNPSQKVNVTLNCTGSEPGLSYYIKNRVLWQFYDMKNTGHNMTDSFYFAYNSPYVEEGKKNGHFEFTYTEDPDTGKITFTLTIIGVTHADDGIYRCSLLDMGNIVKSVDDVRLTVVNRVEKVTLEIHEIMDNNKHKVLKSKTLPVATNDVPLKLTPGMYMVKCVATGSNPAPVMNIFYNTDKPTVHIDSKKDTSGNRVKYTGTVEIQQMEFKASGAEQVVECTANIPSRQFGRKKEAGIKLLVQVEKPDIMCSKAAFRSGDRYQTVTCNLTTPQGGDGLMCDKVAWTFDDKQQRKYIGDTYNDPNGEYDIMETNCVTESFGLETVLTVYLLKPSHFKTIFYLEYGTGDQAHKYPVQFEMTGTAGSSAVSPLSLLACIAMAVLTRLASRHL